MRSPMRMAAGIFCFASANASPLPPNYSQVSVSPVMKPAIPVIPLHPQTSPTAFLSDNSDASVFHPPTDVSSIIPSKLFSIETDDFDGGDPQIQIIPIISEESQPNANTDTIVSLELESPAMNPAISFQSVL